MESFILIGNSTISISFIGVIMFKKLMLAAMLCVASVSQVQSVDPLALITAIDAGQAGWNDAADDDYESRQSIYGSIHAAILGLGCFVGGAMAAGPVGAVLMTPAGAITGKHIVHNGLVFQGAFISRIAQAFRLTQADEAKQEKIDNAKKTTNRLMGNALKSYFKGILGLAVYACVVAPVVALAAAATH